MTSAQAQTTGAEKLEAFLDECPIVGIFRGVRPDEVIEIATAVYEAGVRVIEVPMNSPEPLKSIAALRAHFGERMIVGAGTITHPDQIGALAEAGGQICVSPNCRADVISAAMAANIIPMPGVATPTEAFAAVNAGARHLKLFPASNGGIGMGKALREVLPKGVALIAVGGVSPTNAHEFMSAGFRGLGIGSALYKAGRAAREVGNAASTFVAAVNAEAPRAPVVKTLLSCQNAIGDSPVCLEDGKCIVWIDTVEQTVQTLDTATLEHSSRKLSQPIFAIGQAQDGGLWAITEDAAARLDHKTGQVTVTSDPAPLHEHCRLNNAGMDAGGAIWAGSMDRAARRSKGQLFRFQPDGQVETIADGFGVCNGVAWNKEGSEFYFLDTLERTLTAFAFDAEHGLLGAPRLVFDFLDNKGKPHGLATAPDGSFWVAMWGGQAALNISPNGELTAQIAIPSKHATGCAYSPAKEALIVTSGTFRNTAGDLKDHPDAGGLFEVKLGK